ncbi:MAG: nicotinate-nucleotide adenylyltransferase [Pirellulales bacterium]|nr:nicotinate-nucleotide adenylyltransferase [Pirellulales bacterium]
MRVGIFGGSFDPVHFGHLFLAEYCLEACELDQILFVPAGQPPHKSNRLTAGAHRLTMLKLAIADHPGFAISEVELNRAGPSYSVDTLEQLARDLPSAEMFLLLGADMLQDFPNWRQPQRICELAKLAVVFRDGMTKLDWSVLDSVASSARRREFVSVAMPRMDISSTEIRRRVVGGQSIRYRTPAAVIDYIHSTPDIYSHAVKSVE